MMTYTGETKWVEWNKEERKWLTVTPDTVGAIKVFRCIRSDGKRVWITLPD